METNTIFIIIFLILAYLYAGIAYAESCVSTLTCEGDLKNFEEIRSWVIIGWVPVIIVKVFV